MRWGGGGVKFRHTQAVGGGVRLKFQIIMRCNILFGINGIYSIESIVSADHRSRMLKEVAFLLTLLVMFADARPQPHEVCNHRGSIHVCKNNNHTITEENNER